jgi:hypothetical protein
VPDAETRSRFASLCYGNAVNALDINPGLVVSKVFSLKLKWDKVRLMRDKVRLMRDKVRLMRDNYQGLYLRTQSSLTIFTIKRLSLSLFLHVEIFLKVKNNYKNKL